MKAMVHTAGNMSAASGYGAQDGFSLRLGPAFYAILTGILIFAASDPIYPLLMKGPSEWVLNVPGLDMARRLAWLGIYLAMLAALAAMRHRIPAALANQQLFFLAMGYFLLSSLWSGNPTEGIVGGAQALFTIAFGIVIGVRLGSEGIVKAFFVAAVLVVCFTLIFIVVFPQHAFGFRYNQGALRGVYIEKNHLAQFLSYSVWASVFMCLMYPRSVPLKLFTALTVLLCVMSVSSIALLQIVLVTTCAFYFLAFRNARLRGAIALATAISALAAVAVTLPVLLDMLGEDLTFNGRTTLWAYLWQFIVDQPWIGQGYRGFWHSSDADQMRLILGWPAMGAHNVWLQTLLYGGVIGLLLWAAQWWAVLLWAVRSFARSFDIRQIAMATYIFVTLLWSMFETTQLQHFTHNAILLGIAFSVRAPQFR